MLKKLLPSFLFILFSVFFIEAQAEKDTFKTSDTFYSTTYVGFTLKEKKDITIEVFDVKKTQSYYKKIIKGKLSDGFKVYLGELKKGEYIMEFRNDKGDVLKEFRIEKVQ
ncbi:hypothetical protein [Winogradskyella sp.]|uniref:hypothetical protein n=1 Tax=Winogradskyella sp. TaxID=1883156 RepID=UPI0025F91707|nr:hypothetical protein [Winogradskyella sp.]MBT8245195.1 hypothetical protein [Winogradskyella sp.]